MVLLLASSHTRLTRSSKTHRRQPTLKRRDVHHHLRRRRWSRPFVSSPCMCRAVLAWRETAPLRPPTIYSGTAYTIFVEHQHGVHGTNTSHSYVRGRAKDLRRNYFAVPCFVETIFCRKRQGQAGTHTHTKSSGRGRDVAKELCRAGLSPSGFLLAHQRPSGSFGRASSRHAGKPPKYRSETPTF